MTFDESVCVAARLSILRLILPADLRCPPLAAPKGAKGGQSAAGIH